MIKPKFKIWNWSIKEADELMSKSVYKNQKYYYLNGLTAEYKEGYDLNTSKIVNIDFTKRIVETQNSIYELQYEDFKDRNIEDDESNIYNKLTSINNDKLIDCPDLATEYYSCDNWKILLQEYEPLFDRIFIKNNKRYSFLGLIWTSDDLYFCMYEIGSDNKMNLITCVCDLDTAGYVLA